MRKHSIGIKIVSSDEAATTVAFTLDGAAVGSLVMQTPAAHWFCAVVDSGAASFDGDIAFQQVGDVFGDFDDD